MSADLIDISTVMDFTKEQLDAVTRLFDGKQGARAIAKELGMTRHRVVCIYKQLGLDNSNIKHVTKEIPTHKVCKICSQDKSIDNFRYRKQHNSKYYYEPYCIECEPKLQKDWCAKRYQNKGRLAFDKMYADSKLKEIWLAKNKKYRHANKDILQKKNNKRRRIRRVKDPVFKFRLAVSTSVSTAIKKFGKSKNGSVLKYLPYTIKELTQHLEKQFESWMNWENHGRYNLKTWNDNDTSTWTWQLDHIIPHSDLPYDSMSHPNFQKCWALENLRPLSSKENLLDGVTRIRHKTTLCIAA